MKRKALLLIIPFAAAGLAGCQKANPNPPAPQCDPTGATINHSSITINVNDVYDDLVANAPSGCTFSWSSSNENVAKVDENGAVTGVAEGTAVIKFADASGQGVSCTVTVVPAGQHIHTFSEDWETDENYHWHAATCGHDVVDSQGEHVDNEGDDGKCDVCGFDMSHVVVSSMKEAYEAAAALDNGEKTEEAYEFTGVVTAILNGNGGDTNYYTQEGVYAIDVFKKGGTLSGVKVGSKIKVKATMQKFSDVIETGAIQELDILEDVAVPTPLTVSSYEALANSKLNVLAKITGTVKGFKAPVSGKDYSLILTVGGQDVTVFTKKSIIESLMDSFSALSDGTEVTIDNAVTAIHGDTYQLLTTNNSKVTGSDIPVVELDHIAIEGTATKTTYVEGQAYSADGLHVEAYYKDSSHKTVTATITPEKAKAVLGDTSIKFTVSYQGMNAELSVNVEVTAKPAPTGEIVVDEEYSLTMASLGLGKAYSSNDEGEIGWVDLYGQTDPVDSIQGNKRAASDTKTALNSEIYNILPFSKEIKTVEFSCAKDPRDNKMSIFFGTSNQPSDNEIKLGKGSDHTFAANETTVVEAPKGYKYFDIKWMEYSSVFSSIKFTFESEPEKQLTSLSVKTQPSKVDYNEGESFNSAGLVLHAVYSDSSEEDVTSGWTISPAGALAPTDNKVVVSYGGKSVDVTISVTARELLSIAITSGMSDKEYVVGENWDAAGVVVTGTYNIGDPTVIDSSKYDLTFDPTAPALGVTSVSIVASMKDGSKTSEAFNQTGISVTEAPADPVIGQTFNKISSTTELSDGVYMIVYEDTTSSKVSDGGEGPVDATIENDSIVGVEGQGAFEIKAMTGGYSIKSLSGEKAGKYLSGTSGSNTTNFNDAAVANEITVTDGAADIVSDTSHLRYNSGASKFRYYKASSYSSQGAIALYKQGAPVEPAVLTGIEVSNEHRSFYLGDPFVKETVTASYDKGNPVDVTDKAVFSAVDMNQSGEQTVNVSYTEGEVTKNTSYKITIDTQPAPHVDVTGVSLDKTALTLDEGATATLVATVAPSDASVKTVLWESDDETVAKVVDGVVTAVKEGTANITVTTTEGGKTASCAVTVNATPVHENTVKVAYEAAEPKGKDEYTDALTFTGVVSAIQGSSFVVADGEYGILVYNHAVSGIDVGKTITVKSTLQNYGGLIETKSVTSATLGENGVVPTAVNVASLTDLNNLKTNVLVNATLEVVSKESTWASGTTDNWKVKLAGSEVTLSLNKYVFDSAKSAFLKGLNVGDTFTASNLTVGSYSGTKQLSAMRDSTFVEGPAKVIASLGEVSAPASINKDATLDVNLVNVAVTYEDSTKGSVHPDSIDLITSTVSDSVTGTVHVGELTATFTIKVVEAAQTKDYSFTYASSKNPDGITTTKDATGFETGGRLAQWTSCTGFSISTSASYNGVTKVVISTSSNASNGTYTVSCTVGGVAFGTAVTLDKASSNSDVVFEGTAASGSVVITFTQKSGTTAKSIYIGVITVTAQ